MSRYEFKRRKSLRNEGLFYLSLAVVFALSLAAVFTWKITRVSINGVPARARSIYYEIAVFSLPVAFNVLCCFIGVHALVAWWRERLILEDDRVIWQGIARCVICNFSDINRIRWRSTLWSPAGIILQTRKTRLAFSLTKYNANPFFLICRLRAAAPPELQADWPMFCQRFAMPLLRTVNPKPATAQQIRAWRRNVDWTFGSIILVWLLSGYVAWWRFETLRGWVLVPLPIVLWAATRWNKRFPMAFRPFSNAENIVTSIFLGWTCLPFTAPAFFNGVPARWGLILGPIWLLGVVGYHIWLACRKARLNAASAESAARAWEFQVALWRRSRDTSVDG
ncbi:MAG: hypothetical protein K8T25_20050 [Planctomycetia bacterium]|nr:hypothetical protein [Planctomycetia bacterium]